MDDRRSHLVCQKFWVFLDSTVVISKSAFSPPLVSALCSALVDSTRNVLCQDGDCFRPPVCSLCGEKEHKRLDCPRHAELLASFLAKKEEEKDEDEN